MPASKTNCYNADLQFNLNEFMEKLKKAHDWSETIRVATSVLTKTEGNNLLHLAALHGATDILEKLVAAIEKQTDVNGSMEALSAQNERGYTPLHYAASRGSLDMCKDIIFREDDFDFFYPLIHIRNNKGETPLFLAALHGHRTTFFFLHKISTICPHDGPYFPPWIRYNRDTILHCTISREYFDLSFQIIDVYKDQLIAAVANERGITPLHVLANKPSAFRSGTHFSWFSKVLYSYTTVDPLIKRYSSIEEIEFEFEDNPTAEDVHKSILPKNYGTCLSIYGILRRHVFQLLDLERNSSRGQITRLPPNYATWMEFLKHAFGICGGLGYLHHIKLEKEKHVWASQVMEELIPEYYKPVNPDELVWVDDGSSSSTDVKKDQQRQQGDTSETDDEERMTPLLTAAKNGVIEMVRKILKDVPLAIHETTADMKNILLVAAESRQPLLLQELKNHHAMENLIQAVDDNGNNALHLATKSSAQSFGISGSAIHMQWEIKWYQFVKNMAPGYLNFQTNNGGETPDDMFIQNHNYLAEVSSNWLKETSDSCSVVAVLVAGALFTTLSNVPGGINDQTGEPKLLRDPKLSGYAIISMAGLCFSITSLVTFLIVRTSTQQLSDFTMALPLKLFLGLSFLFLSIVCMLGSFSASLFILLQGRVGKAMLLIYVACLPIPCYAVLQVPVYWDLFYSIWENIPGPRPKDLIIQRSTIGTTTRAK